MTMNILILTLVFLLYVQNLLQADTIKKLTKTNPAPKICALMGLAKLRNQQKNI